MERLGFLKRLLKRVSLTPTSNFENLGTDLINTVSQKIKTRIDRDIYQYSKSRIRANFIKPVQNQINMWLEDKGPAPEIYIELQDLYLAQNIVPSRVGRLIKDNWRRYPALATNLGLVRKGTYSLNTRGVSFLTLISEDEINAFNQYIPDHNPMLINSKQSMLLLYSFLENDGEVIIPLWEKVYTQLGDKFTEKTAGNLIPMIYRSIISRYQKRMLPIDVRERLAVLERTANNISRIPDQGYGGTSPLDTAVRPRIEPYVDLGIFLKKDPYSHEYMFSERGIKLVELLQKVEDITEIKNFLYSNYFQAISYAWSIPATKIENVEEIVRHLKSTAKFISSSSGYTPIEELALLAGINALIDENVYFETGTAREALIAYQKINPYQVRFTVDRMGNLAHAKFME